MGFFKDLIVGALAGAVAGNVVNRANRERELDKEIVILKEKSDKSAKELAKIISEYPGNTWKEKCDAFDVSFKKPIGNWDILKDHPWLKI